MGEQPKQPTQQDLMRISSTSYNDLSGHERGLKLDMMFGAVTQLRNQLTQMRKIQQEQNIVRRNETRILRSLLAENNISISDEDWEARLSDLADQDRGLRKAKEDDVIENFDWVVIKYAGFNSENPEEAIPGTQGENEVYIGAKQFIADFEKALLGMKVGETREKVPCAFPEDYHAKQIAGTTILFDITVVAHKKPLNRPQPPSEPAEAAEVKEG